ncbi:MAG: NYN domain-containing protein [Bacteroidetes bacterium]|nr:NYN domain-containing protein [Bacteroidota bacterium]
MPHLQHHTGTEEDRAYAAVFIDYENIFYYLRQQYTNLPDLSEYALILIRKLRAYLENELRLQPIVRFAYADFERLSQAPMGSLYLMGIEIRNVLGAQHKNAADMRLCIDAMQVLYTRPDIRTFVFVAGDRDYIPVIQHIQTQARTVKTVAFRGNLSGDLLLNIGEENFIDASTLFTKEELERLEKDASYALKAEQLREEARRKQLEQRETEARLAREAAEKRTPSVTAAPSTASAASLPGTPSPTGGQTDKGERGDGAVPTDESKAVKTAAKSRKADTVAEGPTFKTCRPIESEEQRSALSTLLREYGYHAEIWLGPFNRRIADLMPQLADHQRKALVSELEEHGAIRTEQREGIPYDYRVIIVNYNHDDVRELNPG